MKAIAPASGTGGWLVASPGGLAPITVARVPSGRHDLSAHRRMGAVLPTRRLEDAPRVVT
jgi:hypothetical protein